MDNVNYDYVELTDNINRGIIVKMNGRYHYEYDREKKDWIRSGIMMEYFCDESPAYGSYREITEEEAMKLIEEM